MDSKFIAHVEALRPKLKVLLSMKPCKPTSLPQDMPARGIYVLSEADKHLYVGRSNEIKARLGRHCKESATHRHAAFAFRLARLATGNIKPTYKKGEGSRAALIEDPVFVAAFDNAKARIRAMDVRFVEETAPRSCATEITSTQCSSLSALRADPYAQALLPNALYSAQTSGSHSSLLRYRSKKCLQYILFKWHY